MLDVTSSGETEALQVLIDIGMLRYSCHSITIILSYMFISSITVVCSLNWTTVRCSLINQWFGGSVVDGGTCEGESNSRHLAATTGNKRRVVDVSDWHTWKYSH